MYANKQDLPGALSLSEVAQRLGLAELKVRRWKLQPACALSGDGLVEGLEWVNAEHKKQPATA